MKRMNETSGDSRPLTLLIAALGGEGGAVLADWIRDAAIAAGHPVQSTSIPGVAQRTGATTYYIELHPVRRDVLDGRQPVLALTPSPDHVDVMVASELVEAGRAMQNGYVTSRTTLIAATHRIYATSEKMPAGDGRFDATRILAAGPKLARRALFIDMAGLAQRSKTVISAVMFGAIAGTDVLPFTRAQCEAAIRAGGVGVDASLRGFAAGFDAARLDIAPAAEAARATTATSSSSEVNAAAALLQPFAARIERLPVEAQPIVREGVRRTLDYQDASYATAYLDRIEPLAAAGAEPALIREAARFLALWMSYEDIIRVADLKTRRTRFDRVRDEVEAQAGEPLQIVEYLRPGVQEVADLLPPRAAEGLLSLFDSREPVQRKQGGVRIRTTSISGFALLRVLAGLRRMRRRTSRYADEQHSIEAWLAAIRSALAHAQPALAMEIALAARLIKGYGDTHRRAIASFASVMNVASDPSLLPSARADAVRAAREAALGIPQEPQRVSAPAPVAQPIRFMRKDDAVSAGVAPVSR